MKAEQTAHISVPPRTIGFVVVFWRNAAHFSTFIYRNTSQKAVNVSVTVYMYEMYKQSNLSEQSSAFNTNSHLSIAASLFFGLWQCSQSLLKQSVLKKKMDISLVHKLMSGPSGEPSKTEMTEYHFNTKLHLQNRQ
jgi:hypothetical protein